MSRRFHIYRPGPDGQGGKRTTISLPDTLTALLSLHLGQLPDAEAGHATSCAASRRRISARIYGKIVR